MILSDVLVTAKTMIQSARSSRRVANFLLAFSFILTALFTGIHQVILPSQTRLVIAIVLLSAVFGLRYLVEIIPTRLIYWGLLALIWASTIGITFSAGGTESIVVVTVLLVVVFGWLFIGNSAAIVFSAVTLIAAFLFKAQPAENLEFLTHSAYSAITWIYIASGALFAIIGAAMITVSELLEDSPINPQKRTSTRSDQSFRAESHIPAHPEQGPPNESRQLDVLLSLLDAGVFLLDPDNRVCRVNAAAANMIGYPIEDLIGMEFSDLVTFETKSGPSNDISKMFDETGSNVFSRQLIRKDQTVLPVKVRLAAIFDEATGKNYLLQIVRDISDHNALVALMRDSEQKLSAFLDNTRDAVYLKDRAGVYSMINEIGAATLGRPKSAIIGYTDADIFSESDASRIRDFDQQVIETGTSHTEESVFKIGDRIHTFRTTRMPYFSQRGEITGVIGVIRDISTRKRVEADLRTIALRYQALFENNTDGVLVMDLEGKVIDISDLAARMLGYTKADLIGASMDSLVPFSDQDAQQTWRDTIISGKQTSIFEQNFLRQNGNQFPVEINAGLVYDDNGAPMHIQVFFRDITDRKRVDVERIGLLENLRTRTRQIQTAFEVSKSISSTLDFGNLLSQTVEIIKQRFDFYYVGVFLVDEGFAVLAAGSGIQGREMHSAGHKLPIAPSSMVGWCIENKRARIAHDVGKDPVRFDNPMTPKTRSELAMPLIVHSEVIGALTVQSEYPEAFNSEDVAVLQIMADQLAVAVQNARLHEKLTAYAGELEDRVLERTFQLEELNRELEAFSYSVSHDLRAPLRAILGFSNIITDKYDLELSSNVRDYLKKINKNAVRMSALIDDILSFSRMGRQQVRKVPLKLNLLIDEVLDDLEREIEERDIEIRVDELPDVLADPVLLKQVLANLIGNAVKFTRLEEKPTITIGCMIEPDRNVYYIKDNGVGFDMKYSQRIFGVFYRLHGDEEFEGTGVGLAIVQRVIQRHGGKIWYKAEKDIGATFFFSLPDQ